MSFWIQTGNPALQDLDGPADNMADAITMLYPLDTDVLILSWNLVPIVLTYCEDVQVLVDDIVVLLEQLHDPSTRGARVYWGSSTFRAEWWLHRDGRGGENLVIDSRWDSTNGAYESLLNDRAQLTVEALAFTREWLKVLHRLVADIDAKAVVLENTDMLRRARALLAAAQSPGAEGSVTAERAGAAETAGAEVRASGLGAEAGGAESVRFHAATTQDGPGATGSPVALVGGRKGADGSRAAVTLWRTQPPMAHLFAGDARLVADLLGVPSGISVPVGGQCAVDLGEFSVFCATAVAWYAATPHGIQRALTVGFIATSLVLLDRAGYPLPAAASPEQQAAWEALRDQHAAIMPR